MQALTFRQYGSPDFLEIREFEKPRPADDQVLVKVGAVSISDWYMGLLNGSPFLPNRLMAGLFRPHKIIDAKTDRSPADYEGVLKPNGVCATVGGGVFDWVKPDRSFHSCS